jgi:hypothetical protein
MKDRISFNPSELFKKEYMAHLNALVDMGLQMTANTHTDDMVGGQNMGDGGGLTFVKDGALIARAHPRLIEDDNSSLAAFESDVNLIIFILEADEKLITINAQVNQAYILVSKDLMEQANWVLGELKKRKDNPVFAPLYDRLNVLYKKRAERAASTASNKAETSKKIAEAEAKVVEAEAKTAELTRKL